MNHRSIAGIALACLFCLSAWAKEGGDQYAHGAENWFAGAIPPPGSYYINYFGFYSGKLRNGSGSQALVGGAVPTVAATFDAFRFAQITPLKVFGANYGAHVIVPIVYQSMNMNGTASKSAMGDITINPSILGWHHPQWHAVAAFDVFLPTGYYDKDDGRVSIGANYYGFDPLFAISVMPKSGWEASAKLMYNLKTTNRATNYHSGQEFHADCAVGKHIGSWILGGTGYTVDQTTRDTVAGAVVPEASGLWDTGRRGQVVSIGPSVGYNNKRHMIFMADWQHETLVRDRFGGDKFWFKMILPVGGPLEGGRGR